MYPLMIAAGLGLSIILSLTLLPEEPFYIVGPFFGLVAFLPTFMLLSRHISNKIHPFFEKAQRLAQVGKIDDAVKAFEEALGYKRWQLFLEKQVNTQIGVLYYGAGNDKKAVEHLVKGYPKVSEGHTILASILYRAKKLDEATKTLEHGIRYNRRSPILYNLLAWMLNKEGQREAAIEVLSKGLKKLKGDPDTSENLERLQSDKRMDMRSFGQLWYMLKFDTPPGMAQPVRKGFRAPPKKQGKARKRK